MPTSSSSIIVAHTRMRSTMSAMVTKHCLGMREATPCPPQLNPLGHQPLGGGGLIYSPGRLPASVGFLVVPKAPRGSPLTPPFPRPSFHPIPGVRKFILGSVWQIALSAGACLVSVTDGGWWESVGRRQTDWRAGPWASRWPEEPFWGWVQGAGVLATRALGPHPLPTSPLASGISPSGASCPQLWAGKDSPTSPWPSPLPLPRKGFAVQTVQRAPAFIPFP